MQKITTLAKKLVKEAGTKAHQAFLAGNLGSSIKLDHSYLSQYDGQIEKVIRKKINQTFPDHAIHGEEFGGEYNKAGYTWVIDPIEGTTNFVSGISLFCSMIAVVKSGKVVSSAIYDPFSRHTFWAEKGAGAFIDNKRFTARSVASLKECTLIIDSGRDFQKKQLVNRYLADHGTKYRSLRHYGCMASSVKYATWQQPLITIILGVKDHDIAAPSLILQEAGCDIFDPFGKEWHLSSESDFVATGPGIKNKVLETL
ncbi:MAG: inositol monophosphatase [Patescibacteria group bacterium]|nr:inositol monophosphatase [Patescibacteria group bacterium]